MIEKRKCSKLQADISTIRFGEILRVEKMGKKRMIFGGYESPNTKRPLPLQLQFNVACVTILTLWPHLSKRKTQQKKINIFNKKMQSEPRKPFFNFYFFLFVFLCRQILGVANWKLKYHMAAIFQTKLQSRQRFIENFIRQIYARGPELWSLGVLEWSVVWIGETTPTWYHFYSTRALLGFTPCFYLNRF